MSRRQTLLVERPEVVSETSKAKNYFLTGDDVATSNIDYGASGRRESVTSVDSDFPMMTRAKRPSRVSVSHQAISNELNSNMRSRLELGRRPSVASSRRTSVSSQGFSPGPSRRGSVNLLGQSDFENHGVEKSDPFLERPETMDERMERAIQEKEGLTQPRPPITSLQSRSQRLSHSQASLVYLAGTAALIFRNMS